MNKELEEVAERILANNIDGLRDALQDDDLFFFYKDVIQHYGEAMAKWMQERMFSEEDMQKQMYREEEVENIIYELFEDYASNYTNKALEEFEKFKKK